MALALDAPILVVDDYRTMVRILSNMLRRIGFSDVDTASDGRVALAMMAERRYGLVISDWNMEPMHGSELLRAVRADEALRDIPLILMTIDSFARDVAAARASGAVDYILKPFNAGMLKGKIEAVCGGRSATDPSPEAGEVHG